jgi:hypothetical protein
LFEIEKKSAKGLKMDLKLFFVPLKEREREREREAFILSDVNGSLQRSHSKSTLTITEQ